jgi:glutamate decarboxylase
MSLFDTPHSLATQNVMYDPDDVPKYSFPPTDAPKDTTYQLIHDEMELDGAPILNPASFIRTEWTSKETS